MYCVVLPDHFRLHQTLTTNIWNEPTPDIIEHFNDQIRDLANSDKEVHKELTENTTRNEFKDEEQYDDDN